MKTYDDLYNLNHINLAVGTLKSKLAGSDLRIWIGFDDTRYYIIDEDLLYQFIRNFKLEDDDLIEEIF
jgi:hypothetical protein